eukprot:1345689-Amphidinium_carterae.1
MLPHAHSVEISGNLQIPSGASMRHDFQRSRAAQVNAFAKRTSRFGSDVLHEDNFLQNDNA